MVKTKVKFVTPEKIIKERRRKDRNVVRSKRIGNTEAPYAPEKKICAGMEGGVVLVVRIRGLVKPIKLV